MGLKSWYVSLMRSLRRLLASAGLLDALDSRIDSRSWGWLRSLLSIYDFDDFCKLKKPWWVYEATDLVEHFLVARGGEVEILEYGSGASTIWLAKYASTLHSIEHDEAFYEYLRRKPLSEVIHLHLYKPIPGATGLQSERREWRNHDFSKYVQAEDVPAGLFDLIVIDGRCRLACLRVACKRLKPDGLIVFDNSSRRRYAAGLAGAPLSILKVKGLAPSLPYREETSLLGSKQVIDDLRIFADAAR